MKRRDFLRMSVVTGVTGLTGAMSGFGLLSGKAYAAALVPGLSDPLIQPLFTEMVISALDPSFKFIASASNSYNITMRQQPQYTGLEQCWYSLSNYSLGVWGSIR